VTGREEARLRARTTSTEGVLSIAVLEAFTGLFDARTVPRLDPGNPWGWIPYVRGNGGLWLFRLFRE
jgi:hypothetical protein